VESLLEQKDRLFKVAEKSSSIPFFYTGINFDRYMEFNKSISKFSREIRDRQVLDYWYPIIQQYAKISMLLGTTPFQAHELESLYPIKDPPSNLTGSAESSLLIIFDEVRLNFDKIRESPNYLWDNFVRRIKIKIEETDINDNDLKILNGYGIVCPWNELLEEFKQKIEKINIPNLNVYLRSDLKLVEPLFHMTVLGSSGYYDKIGSGHIFNNPRSKFTEIIAYNIFLQPRLGEYYLTGSPHNFIKSSEIQPTERKKGVEFLPEIKIQENTYVKKEDDTFSGDEFRIDLKDYFDSNIQFGNGIITYEKNSKTDELIKVATLKLSSSHGVLVDPDSDRGVLSANTIFKNERLICSGITHTDFNDLNGGDILIFSTGGGGEMISLVANALMREKAGKYRELQNHWKSELRKLIDKHGYSKLVDFFQKSGLEIASQANFQNWSNRSPSTIAPYNREHHRLILTNCGLKDKIEKIFEATDVIRKAHRIAGKTLSRMLMEQLEGSPLDDLRSTGRQDFGGTDKIPTQKSMFFLEQVLQGYNYASPHDINQPHPLTVY